MAQKLPTFLPLLFGVLIFFAGAWGKGYSQSLMEGGVAFVGYTNGTLSNTGLNQGSTAILLSHNVQFGQYTGSRAGNTSSGYINLLNNITSETSQNDNWEQLNGTGDQKGKVLSFDTQSFVIVDPPTVRFTTSVITVAEGVGSATLTVELAEATGEAVSVDIVFLSSSSSAATEDIGDYSTQTVTFSSSAASGASKSVSINITDDNTFEGDEMAVFHLKNNSIGSVVKPATVTLTISDNETPQIVINEFLADPASGSVGDANSDGTRDSSEDEFIEIVNTSSLDIDISGWKLSDDGTTVRYTFPSGTVLAANSAAVVFGGGKPSGNFGAAVIQTATGLSLNNGGDSPTLVNANGNIIQQVTYNGSVSDESITRDPDISGNFGAHSSATGSNGALFSPGTKVDGQAFGSTYAIAFRGSPGWRMIASPTQNTTFDDLFSQFWMQGIPGSDEPSAGVTLYSWSEENTAFTPVRNMGDELVAGKGYIVFPFADNEVSTPGLQGDFSKIISTDHPENSSPVSVSVISNDSDGSGSIDNNEGWNMLGNPYGTSISVAAVKNALEAVNSNLNANVYVWNSAANNGNGDYKVLTDGDLIAPFQAFFVRYIVSGVSGSASFDRSALAANQRTVFYDRQKFQNEGFKIMLGDGEKYDEYYVRFRPDGTLGEDLRDAYKLFSLNPNSINLFSTLSQGTKLAINVLPSLNELDRKIYIPLRYQLPHSGDYLFWWDKVDKLPRKVEVYLIDNKTGRKVNLRERQELSFSYFGPDKQKLAQRSAPMLNVTKDVEDKPRFELLIAFYKIEEPGKEMQKSVTLSPNYPNPFRTQTEMSFKLKEPGRVSITIWNIVGQKVATIYENKMMSDGSHTYYWNAGSDLPSGIYICKLEAAGKVLIRKMTLIK